MSVVDLAQRERVERAVRRFLARPQPPKFKMTRDVIYRRFAAKFPVALVDAVLFAMEDDGRIVVRVKRSSQRRWWLYSLCVDSSLSVSDRD